MSLSESLLGDNGDQTVAVDIPEIVFKPGDRVLHINTRSTGVVGCKKRSWYQEYEVPVKWDHRSHSGFIAETKHHLLLL